MPNQKIELIDAIAIARGTEEPTNRDVFWLDKSLTGGFYDRLKSYNYDTEQWELVSRSNQEILSDLRTVDGAGSGLDSDTLQGYTPDQLISQGASGLPAMSTGKVIVGQADTIGKAKTLGGIATIDANGSMAYVPNSISHTGLTDVGTNTHVQIDSHIADSAIHLSAAQSTKLGHISVTQAVDLDQMETDITANNAKPTNNLATGDLTQAAAARTYNMNNQNLTFNNGYLKVTDAGFGDMFYLEHGGGDITFGGATGVGAGGSNWVHQTNFNTASSTAWEHRDFGGNTGLQIANWTTTGGLNQYSSISYKGGVGQLYILNDSGSIELGSSTTISVGYGTGAQRPETVKLIAGAGQLEVSGTSGGTGSTTFTDSSSTTAGIEYAADYSSDFTARSLVDKAYVDANAGGSSLYTASGTVPTSVVATITDTLDFNEGTFNLFGLEKTKKLVYVGGSGSFGAYKDGVLNFHFNPTSGQGRLWPVTSGGSNGKLLLNGTSVEIENIRTKAPVVFGDAGQSSGDANNLEFAFNGYSWKGINFLITQLSGGGADLEIQTSPAGLAGTYESAFKVNKNKTVDILGDDTLSTSSAFRVYDGDSTPNLLWDFRNNGNVHINQNSDLEIGSNFFNFTNGNKKIGIPSWNTHVRWSIDNGNSVRWDLISANSSSSFNAGEFGIAKGSLIPLRVFDGTRVAVGNVAKSNLDTNYTLQTSGEALIGGDLHAKTGTDFLEFDFANYSKIKIGTSTSQWWLVNSNASRSSTFDDNDLFVWDSTNSRKVMQFKANGTINMPTLPTSASGLSTGDLYNDSGTIKIV